MVRNGLGVDARGGRVRATSATSSARVVVVEDAPFLDVSEALRIALGSARAKFGEPEAIALVHDDDLAVSDLEQLKREAQRSDVGEVRLVPESVALPLAENEDVAPELLAATGAAIWLLRERRGIVVPPPVPQRQDGEDGTRKMDDFGQGRRMSDFGGGSAMADHGDGRRMSDFGEGATMADFGEPRGRRRSRLAIAAVAALIVAAVGTFAARGLSNGTSVDSVASTDTTTADGSDEATTTTVDLEAGPQTTADDTTTTTALAAEVSGSSTTAATTTTAVTTTTVAARTTRTYDVVALLESYASDAQTPRLTQGDRAAGTVTLTCTDAGVCEGSLAVAEWNLVHAFDGQLADGSLDDTNTFQPDECVDPVEATFTFTGLFDETSMSGEVSQAFKPRRCQGADGRAVFLEDLVVSFATQTQIR